MSANKQQEERFKVNDYYAVLGLDGPTAADPALIRKQYRQLALKWHPDKHADGTEKDKAIKVFHRINEAHEVLSDTSTRARYDEVWRRVHQRAPPSGMRQGQPAEGEAPKPAPRRAPGGSVRELRQSMARASEEAEEAQRQKERDERRQANAEAVRREEALLLRQRQEESKREYKETLRKEIWEVHGGEKARSRKESTWASRTFGDSGTPLAPPKDAEASGRLGSAKARSRQGSKEAPSRSGSKCNDLEAGFGASGEQDLLRSDSLRSAFSRSDTKNPSRSFDSADLPYAPKSQTSCTKSPLLLYMERLRKDKEAKDKLARA